MLLLLDLLSTVCFAGTAASIAIRQKLNVYFVSLSAMIASTGGGTTREILLGSNTLFWLEMPVYLIAVLLAIVLAYFVKNVADIPHSLASLADSFATTVFIFVGVIAAFNANSNLLNCLLMGVLTGIGGGIIRQAIFDRESFWSNGANILSTTYTAMISIILISQSFNLLASILLLGFVHASINAKCSVNFFTFNSTAQTEATVS